MASNEYHKNVYRGITLKGTHSRTYSEYEKFWLGANLSLPSFDSLILQSLHASVQNGKRTILGIDVGATEYGLNNLLSHTSLIVPKTVQLLKSNREFSVRLLGITDVPQKNFPSKINIIPQQLSIPVETSQLQGEIAYHSVTSDQKLSSFFESQNINEIDFGVSQSTLTYLTPDVFEDVITDIAERLSSNGRFIGVEYATVGPHMLSLDFGRRRGQTLENPMTTIKQELEEITLSDIIDKERALGILSKTIKILSQQELKDLETALLPHIMFEHDQLKLLRLYVERAENLIAHRGRDEIRKLKEKKLQQLRKKFGKTVKVEYTNDVIVLHKAA